MKISNVDAFQMEWGETGKGPRSAFVRIETEDGQFGLGEASPMEGGLASLVIVAKHMAPFLVGKDALDHAVLTETLFHKLVKLGPEGALTGALAARGHRAVGSQGQATPAAGSQAPRRSMADEPDLLCIDRRQCLAHGR